jgi:hypothetical protein
MSRTPLRAGLALLAACVLSGTPAAAASISGLSISNGSTNFFDDVGATGSVGQSGTSVLANGATGFGMRYAAVVGADTGGAGGGTFTQNFTGSFTITFSVTQVAGWNWTVNVDVLRNGARTIINDGPGNANVTLGALDVVHSGAGVLGASLGLGAVGTLSNAGAPGNSLNSGFNQASTAAITGNGTGAAQVVTLVFTFTASATTVDPAGGQVQGDEAALRMGIDSILSSFTADDYPGTGGRTLANDGIFVTAAVGVPEPAAEALLAVGLIGLAWFANPRTPRPGRRD